jgi:hypothetical protein
MKRQGLPAKTAPEGRLEGYYLDDRLELAAQLGITPKRGSAPSLQEKQKLNSCVTRCVKFHVF